ncbi:MAG: hypothetical protein F4060_10465 [Holophagales bacterium]|nr:hypothetical protein [Holophagales bacterium]MYG30915.1 hypothetical protein [Holophagales bacterium]MYI80346.1 hypothetical protein [Holophagales bacterium]
MNVSILHISDLHWGRNGSIRHDVLPDSLVNDCRHFSAEEEPRVRAPDVIVVSGDIIHGIDFDVDEPEESLRAQYGGASAFLAGLADRFVSGDRQRVVVVPGNHDVSSYHLAKSLELIDVPSDRQIPLSDQLFSLESPFRWSWKELELYRICDTSMYRKRMSAFAEFYADFYDGQRHFDLDPADQVEVFDYPELGLTIVGFSSCYNNDRLKKQGAIHPACIAEVGTRLRERAFASRLRVAAWHHNVEGSPYRVDYMDPDLLQNLIDRGFSLGLHGHQHRPQYLSTRFRHEVDRKMTVISAGTLCGGPGLGHARSYNVIELCTAARAGRLHVREMQNADGDLPIWGRRVLPTVGQRYLEFDYDPPPPPVASTGGATPVLMEAQTLHLRGAYRNAADLLTGVLQRDSLSRPLLLDCLVRLKDAESIVDLFDPPVSEAEAVHLMDALWETGRRDRLSELLAQPLVADSDDPSVAEMREKYRARAR